MKKLLLGYLILITACQSAPSTPIPGEVSTPTATMIPPSSETATATGTFTPVPTSTPVPLFFTDDFNGDMGAWVSFQTGGAESPAVKLENDFLRIDFSTPDIWYYAIHNAHEYSDVSVSAKFSGTPAGSLGVICNYDEAKGWYEFNIASDESYSILFGKWLAPGIAQYTPIAIEDEDYLKVGSLSYEIGLTCQGDTLSPLINGKPFRNVNVARFGLTGGKIGITASSFDELPMIATFDWFRVEEPTQ